MAEVRPFKCWRPCVEKAAEVAATPYDTVSRAEAAAEIEAHPLSFLRIDKPAALFDSSVDEYDPCVYARARAELDAWFDEGIMESDPECPELCYAAYRLTQGAHAQTGILACASVADYNNGVIKRHENTRRIKETDRIEHIKALEAHTGPVLLTYRGTPELNELLARIVTHQQALFDFVAPDGVRHEFWPVKDAPSIKSIQEAFKTIPTLYIADGHHRAAAAARVGELYSAKECPESQYFLTYLVASEELQVLDYNRVVADLAGLQASELLERLEEVMAVELCGPEPYRPAQRGEFSLFLEGNWYKLTFPEDQRPRDAVEGLDVALLHRTVLEPLLAIDDPRGNPRISYVGGIRGLEELAERASKTGGAAFALYPCSLPELFAVADAGRLMPPKSTWFEPKPRSGLAIHRIC